MQIFIIITTVCAFLSFLGLCASVRRLAVAWEVLVAHNLKFPAPEPEEPVEDDTNTRS